MSDQYEPHSCHGFDEDQDSMWAEMLTELDEEPLEFCKGLFNALGFAAVLYFFVWFMYNVLPHFVCSFMPWLIAHTGGQ